MTETDTLLAELVALAPPVRQAGDIDAEQYSAQLNNGMKPRYCARILDDLVEKGLLTPHDVYDPDKGHKVRVYRKVV